MNQESMVMWSEISSASYDFSRSTKLAERLTTITVNDVKAFFDKYIKFGSPHRVKFCSQFFGKDTDLSVKKEVTDGAASIVYIDDPVAFKRGMSLRANRSYLETALAEAASRG
jgi:hypothetical protein